MTESAISTTTLEADEICVLTSKGVRESRKSTDIRGHDFRQSGFLAASELRRIRQRHEQFIRGLAARLAIFLRLEFSLQLSKVQIVGYQKFTENLPNPTHITLFKTEPLKGVGLLIIPPRLGLTLVDRLLGGPGQASEERHDLTEIEIALIDQVASLILAEWCNHWPEMRELSPVMLGHENNSRFLQTALPETAMLILNMTGGIGEQAETIQMVFPYATVEPLMRLLSPALPGSEEAPARNAGVKWNPEFNEMKMPVIAEWQGLKMSAGQITRLKAGDVLALDPACAAQVQIRVNTLPKFTGRPGTSGGKWAVQLTAITNHNDLK
jgi:flagellar motor switch protein FliM